MGPDDKKLDASWIVAFDEQGHDLALEAELAALTPEERARTEVNVRAFIDEVKPTVRRRSK